ncbi:unnamed protein product [Durusdinium trenchii]|uniref:Uncharacterized protein n=1 Tax=Durusdinium trenchii TaxID=1381693 RepID=A0ABP0KRT8_9DINO
MQALLESKKKDDPDAYDPVEADVSSSEESGDDDDMQGQDIPDQQPMAPSSPPPHPFIPFPDSQPIFEREHDQPIPPEEPTPAMPIHPAAETAPGPSSGVLRSYKLDVLHLHTQIENFKQRSQNWRLREKKSRISASMAKNEIRKHGTTKGAHRALPTPVRGNADNLDTQPIDIMKESAVPGDVVLLRSDQLAHKSTVKSSKKRTKEAAGKRKGKKSKKAAGKRKGKKSKKTKKSPKKKVHRARRVLHNAAAAASSSHIGPEVAEVGGPKPRRKRKTEPLADSHPEASGRKRPKQPAKKEPQEEVSSLAGAASSSAAGKRTAAKASARKPKVAVEGKVKEGKTKAAAKPKPKAKSRAKKGSADSSAIPAEPADIKLAQSLVDFALQFDEKDSPKSEPYKLKIKGDLTGLKAHTLNCYWSKCGCGLKIIAEGKDGHHCSFNNVCSPESWKMAICAKIAYMTALNLEGRSPPQRGNAQALRAHGL